MNDEVVVDVPVEEYPVEEYQDVQDIIVNIDTDEIVNQIIQLQLSSDSIKEEILLMRIDNDIQYQKFNESLQYISNYLTLIFMILSIFAGFWIGFRIGKKG